MHIGKIQEGGNQLIRKNLIGAFRRISEGKKSSKTMTTGVPMPKRDENLLQKKKNKKPGDKKLLPTARKKRRQNRNPDQILGGRRQEARGIQKTKLGTKKGVYEFTLDRKKNFGKDFGKKGKLLILS